LVPITASLEKGVSHTKTVEQEEGYCGKKLPQGNEETRGGGCYISW